MSELQEGKRAHVVSLRSKLYRDFFLPPTPDVIVLKERQRLVAIGDIHGDIAFLKSSLIAGGLVDKDNTDQWIGGDTICVQVGDVLDRGCHEIACLLLLTKLARQAVKEGGAVVILWGNHEIENATGCNSFPMDYADDFDGIYGPMLDSEWKANWRLQYPDTKPVRLAFFEPGGLLASPLLRNLKIAVKVGKSVLVHGGLTMDHLNANGGIKGLNKLAREWITKGGIPKPFSVKRVGRVKAIDAKFPSWIGAIDSPMWMRDYSQGRQLKHGEGIRVDAVLKGLQADRILVGHTVHAMIQSVHSGKVWRLDIGGDMRWVQLHPSARLSELCVLQVCMNVGGEELVSVVSKEPPPIRPPIRAHRRESSTGHYIW
jgi:hydrogenase maturation factor